MNLEKTTRNTKITDVEDSKSESDIYHVVTKTLVGPSEGIITRSCFTSQKEFKEWYRGRMQDGTNRPLNKVYEIVAEGVSDEMATKLIHSNHPSAYIISAMKEAAQYPAEMRADFLDMKLQNIAFAIADDVKYNTRHPQ